MLFSLVLFSISISALIIATITDTRERIVPNKLTLPLIALGIGINSLHSLATGNWSFAAFSMAAAVYTFGFSLALYRTGGWAGGDVKLFTALAALNPLNPFIAGKLGLSVALFEPISLPLFPVALFVFSVISMFPVALFIALKRAVKEKKAFLLLVRDLVVVIALSVLIVFFSTSSFSFAVVPLLALPVAYFVASLMLSCRMFLKKSIRISELEEGMIPAERIVELNGRIERVYWKGMKSFINYLKHYKIAGAKAQSQRVIADYARARGVTAKEIEELKTLVKDGKLDDHITVKESAPMVPAILAGYILLNIVGDLLWHVVGLA